MEPARYGRAADAVWRLAPGLVIVRHASADVAADGVDLAGVAALVWIVLDETGTIEDLVQRLADEDLAPPAAEVDRVIGQLVEAGWVRRVSRDAVGD